MGKTILAALMMSFAVATATADEVIIGSVEKEISKDEVGSVSIYFLADVSMPSVNELLLDLHNIEMNYPNVKNIYLLISSYGGDMDAGYIAYQAIRSMPVPVTTINLSDVSSAATMLYCGGESRLGVDSSYFLLHPAKIRDSSWQDPTAISQLLQENKRYNSLFKKIYGSCTNFNDTEIEAFLNSESNRLYISQEEALFRKLSTGVIDKLPTSELVYTIRDDYSH
ncbi:ATP-dependent Clp protease proteolytic subunit [Kiloniella laminariae]|uniref:ATP-dependent Clp protease proteolytic subunit n=1 Tax=Kiloniella laminariae TaxID=454162 RepID=A0ABT4LNY5_9PROT|nr:ATP-dependent Clp protease proteolytic subunit [Kiloniella laminariae]MCZ4282813.1 ATP-dependent Clp protease proteolytic subunit [Kiloniella laminariae]